MAPLPLSEPFLYNSDVMRSDADYDAIIFDLLDTLYPWGPDRYSRALNALCETVSLRCPPLTPDEVRERYIEVRTRYSSRNLPRLVENDFPAAVTDLCRACGSASPAELAAESIADYEAALAAALELPTEVGEMVRRLSSRYKLGVMSNYPTSGGIRAALQRDGLTEFVGAVVVSSEVGFIKPHSAMFREALSLLDCALDGALVVGDTWESDIVGAHLCGIASVRVRPSEAGVEQGRSFNGYIRRWLESQPDGEWKKAKPLAELERVVDLEPWLDLRRGMALWD